MINYRINIYELKRKQNIKYTTKILRLKLIPIECASTTI